MLTIFPGKAKYFSQWIKPGPIWWFPLSDKMWQILCDINFIKHLPISTSWEHFQWQTKCTLEANCQSVDIASEGGSHVWLCHGYSRPHSKSLHTFFPLFNIDIYYGMLQKTVSYMQSVAWEGCDYVQNTFYEIIKC